MSKNPRRRYALIAVALLVLAIILALTRCSRPERGADSRDTGAKPAGPVAAQEPDAPAAAGPDEVLSPARLTAPARVLAGAAFSVAWTGPDNRGDHVTVVRADARDDAYADTRETKNGPTLELTAAVEPGAYEVRYVTGRSHTILGRAPIEVVAADATLDAVGEIPIGVQLPVAWTGPHNPGDFITIVPAGTPDGQRGVSQGTDRGSPVQLTVPTEAGDYELRYGTGQGNRVLARRPIRVVTAAATLAAPDEAVAGATIEVAWTGPDNPGDFITAVAAGTPDNQYGNRTNTAKGSPAKLLVPIRDGAAELRYATGQGGRVLARRPIRVVAAVVALSAPPDAKVDADVRVTWTGPGNPGDFITVVPKSTPDGRAGSLADTVKGSPATVKAPHEAGDAEVRYVSRQGNTVLARIPIRIVP